MLQKEYLILSVLIAGIACGPESTFAAEGGSSDYLPGTAGDFGTALPPKPGPQVANIIWLSNSVVSVKPSWAGILAGSGLSTKSLPVL